jgi:pseudouridylate synthase
MTLTFSPAVATARQNRSPIVALESTIITHGMPWPQNVETARLVEQTVRDAGATPATIAVMAGRIHIGLTDAELETLGQSRNVAKLSRHHDLRPSCRDRRLCHRRHRRRASRGRDHI